MFLHDTATALSALVFSMAIYLFSLRYPSQVRLFPQLLAVILGFLALLMIGRAFLSKRKFDTRNSEKLFIEPVSIVLSITLTAIYIWAVPALGFVTSSFLFIVAMSWLMGYRKIKVLLAATIIFLTVLVGLIHFALKLPLPPDLINTIWDYIK